MTRPRTKVMRRRLPKENTDWTRRGQVIGWARSVAGCTYAQSEFGLIESSEDQSLSTWELECGPVGSFDRSEFAGCTYEQSEFGLVEPSGRSESVQLIVGMWSGRVFGSIGVCWLLLRGNRGLVWSDLRMDQSLFNGIIVPAGF